VDLPIAHLVGATVRIAPRDGWQDAGGDELAHGGGRVPVEGPEALHRVVEEPVVTLQERELVLLSSALRVVSSFAVPSISSRNRTAWSGDPLFTFSASARWLMLVDAPGVLAAISAQRAAVS
jgi:hypothetical protein